MGNDAVDSMLYAINKETGEEFAVGGIVEMPKLAPGGIVNEIEQISNLGENLEAVITVKLKTITKKRFIKLLMGKGYQRNNAIEMHEKYMNEHEFIRSRLGLEIFIIKQNVESKEFKVIVGGKEVNVNGKTNNM